MFYSYNVYIPYREQHILPEMYRKRLDDDFFETIRIYVCKPRYVIRYQTRQLNYDSLIKQKDMDMDFRNNQNWTVVSYQCFVNNTTFLLSCPVEKFMHKIDLANIRSQRESLTNLLCLALEKGCAPDVLNMCDTLW